MELTDPEVLHCNTCKGPLISPVYQCSTGHTACDQCRKKRRKCTICGKDIGSIRCLAIEKVIESIKLPCKNARYGCKETIFYNHKTKHESSCIYASCSCPILHCNFNGSSQELSLHFTAKHSSSAKPLRFKALFEVCFGKDESLLILREEVEGLLFLLHRNYLFYGSFITVSYIGSINSAKGFVYKIVYTTRKGGCLKIKSSVERVKGREGAVSYSYSCSRAELLLVPNEFSGSSSEQLKLRVCILRSQ